MKCYLSMIISVMIYIYIATPLSYFTATYSNSLTSSSPTFTRPGTTTRSYYYVATRVFVSTSGTYEFSSSSSLDTYGYFYDGSFNASNPSLNLVAQNDDGLGSRQFFISRYLVAGGTYTLVGTTSGSWSTGNLTIAALGPSTVQFSSVTSNSTPAKALISTSE
jgi:hypothetical protein